MTQYHKKKSAVSILNRLAREKVIPLSCQINLTSACNLNCIHCYVDHKRSLDLDTPRVKSLLDELASLGCLHLTFSGGEPMTRPDIFEILNDAYSKKFMTRLFTNGSLITDKDVAQKIKDTGVWEVHMSVYSTEEKIHDAITGQRGSLTKTLQALTWLKELNVPLVIKCPIMTINFKSYMSVHELAKELECDYMFDPNVHVGESGNKNPLQYTLDHKQLAAVLNNPLFEEHDAPLQEQKHQRIQKNDEALGPDERVCSAGYTRLNILSNGDVTPCIDWPLVCGNVHQTPLKNIWEGKEMQYIRSLKYEHFKACDCEDIHGICPGKSLTETGDQLSFTPSSCARHKAREQS